MKLTICISMAAFVMIQTSCMTRAVWESTDPDEYVEVEDRAVSDDDLNAAGVDYKRDDATGRLYVKKRALHKLGDYTVRTLATPITITLDTAGAVASIFVVGTVLNYKKDWERGIVEHPDTPEPILVYPEEDENSVLRRAE